MTRRDACLAAGAAVEIDVESVLLARARGRRRNQCGIVAPLERGSHIVMKLRESFDSREIGLIEQKVRDQIAGTLFMRTTPLRKRRKSSGRFLRRASSTGAPDRLWVGFGSAATDLPGDRVVVWNDDRSSLNAAKAFQGE